MKKLTAGVVSSARPNWQRNVLSKAIAMAGASLQASAAFAAACPTATGGQLTATCTLAGGASTTINNGGSIIVNGAPAIQLSGGGNKTIVNSGTLSGASAAIQDQLAATGTVTITNNATGVISGQTTGIWINSGSDLVLSNSGMVSGGGSLSSEGYGVYMSGDLGGSITNSGTISGSAIGTTEGFLYVRAAGVFVDGSVTGTITNSGTISGSASASGAGTAGGIVIFGDLAGTLTNTGDISATASGYYADAEGIYIDGSLTGSLTNDTGGTITATATGGDGASTGGAYGIDIYSSIAAAASLNNAGTITATATGVSSESAYAAGIYADSTVYGVIDNSGTINATATATATAAFVFAEADGIYVSSLAAGGTVTNSGTINATATGPDYVYASGIYIDYMASSIPDTVALSMSALTAGASVTNSGSINVTVSSGSSDATADGIYIYSMGTGASVTNTGSITVSGSAFDTASVAGIYVDQAMAGSIDNSGTISVDASASNSAFAGGIYMTSSMLAGSSVTNSGTIEVTAGADGAEGVGIFVYDQIDGAIDNSGTIDVTVTGSSYASAGGIVGFSTLGPNGSITNSGSVDVAATAGSYAYAAGILVSRSMAGSPITNSGSVSVAANGGSYAGARGIYVDSTMLAGASITNSGSIDVSASVNSTTGGSAWADGIYVWGALQSGASIQNSGTITVSTYNPGPGFDGAEGIHVGSLQTGAVLDNSGTVDVTAGGYATESGTFPYAFGVVVQSMSGGATLTNSGTISANGPAGSGSGWALVVFNGFSTGELGFPVVSNSGVMRGNIYLNNTSLTNSGLLSIPVSNPSGPYSQINNGNYTQLAGGVLEIGAYSSTMYGRLVVNGTADFTASGQFAVNVAPYDLLNPGDILDNVVYSTNLVSGGDSNLSVTDNSPFWQFTATDDGEGGIDLTVAGQPRGFLTAAGAQVMNVNLDALQGEVMGRMDITRLVRREGGHAQNLWFRPYGSWATLDDNGSNSVGYDNDTYGMVIGYDTYLDGSDWNFGGAFSYANSSVEGKSSLNKDKIDTDLYSGSIYAYGNLSPDTFVDLLAIGGWGSNDTHRNLGINGTATGDYDSWYARLSAAIGRNFQMNEQWTFTPKGSLIYTYVNEDSYKEKGPAGLALDVDSTDADSLIFMLDGIFSYQINSGALLTAHVGGGYDALADDLNVDATFVGGTTTFKTKAKGPDDWLAVAGIGAEFEASDTVEIHFNYDYEYRNDFSNNQVVGTLRWKL